MARIPDPVPRSRSAEKLPQALQEPFLRFLRAPRREGARQLLKEPSLLRGEARGDLHLDDHQQVPTAVAPQVGNAPPPQPDHMPRLGPRRDLHQLLSLQGGDRDAIPQSRLGHVDGHLDDQVIPPTPEVGMRLDFDLDVKVARRPAVLPRLPLPGDADLHPVVHAGRDADGEATTGEHAPFPAALPAWGGDHLAGPLAGRAGGDLDERAQEGLAHPPHLADAAAGRAAGRAGPGLRAVPPAARAWLVADDLHILLHAPGGLFERQRDLGLKVRTAPGRPPCPRADPESEEILEEIGEEVREIRRLRAQPPPFQPGVAIHVIDPSLLLIGEDGVGLVDLFEFLLGVRRLVDIRVILAGQPSIGLLDLLQRGVAWDAEDLVVVLPESRHGALSALCG
jgi:hypothetical protein